MRTPGVDISFLGRSSVDAAVVIHIAADHELPLSYADELRKVARDHMGDEGLTVKVVALRGLWRSDQDEGHSSEE
jgi:hypothetical protein